MVHRTIPEHIPVEHKTELIPGLREFNHALEEAASSCTYAECRLIMITSGAEENHRTFIHKGLWASGEGGQVPKTVDIQMSLTSAAESQREIQVWQGFFHNKLDKLHDEIQAAEIRAGKPFTFEGFQNLKERVNLRRYYLDEHFMQ